MGHLDVIWPKSLLKQGHLVLIVNKLTGQYFLLLILTYPFQSHLKKRAFASEFKL